jgi:hypothetical protein
MIGNREYFPAFRRTLGIIAKGIIAKGRTGCVSQPEMRRSRLQ